MRLQRHLNALERNWIFGSEDFDYFPKKTPVVIDTGQQFPGIYRLTDSCNPVCIGSELCFRLGVSLKQPIEFLRPNRLRDVAIHARGKTSLSISIHRKSGHRDDRLMLT